MGFLTGIHFNKVGGYLERTIFPLTSLQIHDILYKYAAQ